MKIAGNLAQTAINAQLLAELKARIPATPGDAQQLEFAAADIARLIALYEASRVVIGAPTLTVN